MFQEIKKKQISQTMSQISRTHCHDQKIKNELRKNKNSIEIFNIRMHQKHTDILKINRILLKIHYKFY